MECVLFNTTKAATAAAFVRFLVACFATLVVVGFFTEVCAGLDLLVVGRDQGSGSSERGGKHMCTSCLWWSVDSGIFVVVGELEVFDQASHPCPSWFDSFLLRRAVVQADLWPAQVSAAAVIKVVVCPR